MQIPPSLHKFSVTWRGKRFVVEMNSGATVKDLGQELQKLTNVQEDTMRLIIPQVSNKASKLMFPFSAEDGFLRLEEASITEAKSIKMMGVLTNEVEQVLQDAKANLRIAGFEDEEKRLKHRSSYGPHVSLKLPQGHYIFSDFQTLEIPGVKLNPLPSEALKRMHMLAADPGIVAIMNKHRWHVGVMTEMAPLGYVGVSPKCILGFNKNHGEEISLRLRTDDLRGFRKYESIKKTLLHELAHMVYSEHDANFYALDKQLNQEAASLDWTRSASHTLSGVRNSDYFEEDFVRNSGNIPQKLGGSGSDQLTSARASSVAAAYYRMTNASTKKAGGSEVNEEPDPDDSIFNATDGADHINSKSKEIIDIDMTFHAEKGPKSEPDPDDQLANVMKHEPDPDDSNHVQAFSSDVCSGITYTDELEAEKKILMHNKNMVSDLSVSYVTINVGPQVIESTYCKEPADNEPTAEAVVLAEPDPDDVMVPPPELSTMQTNEPDPDDQELQRINDPVTTKVGPQVVESRDCKEPFHNEPNAEVVVLAEPDPDDVVVPPPELSTMQTDEPDSDDQELQRINDPVTINVRPQVIESMDSKEPAHNESNEVVVLAEPDPDDVVVAPPELSTMQTDEPDPDDQELQRINDPVTNVCNRLQKTLVVLRTEVSPMQTASVLQTLLKIIRNVIEHPEEAKYKRLRKANPVIERNIVNNKAALEILLLVGFKEDVMLDELGKAEAYLVLNRNDPGLLWLVKSSLESCTNF